MARRRTRAAQPRTRLGSPIAGVPAMRKSWSRWVYRGLAGAGLPVVTHCNPFGCPPGTGPHTVAWDGGIRDGGSISTAGELDDETCTSLCGTVPCSIADAGLVQCPNTCVGGRAPPGLQTLSAVDGSAGSWLARMA